MSTYYDIFNTAFGWIGVLASGKGIRRSTLPENAPINCLETLGLEANYAIQNPSYFCDLRNRIIQYFKGEPESFNDILVDVSDRSAFYRAAWQACRSIPYGETRTYGWLAAAAGNPYASRAAGQSMARNQLAIIVPCHRIIASNGGLGGFGKEATQLDLKRRLLQMESAYPMQTM